MKKKIASLVMNIVTVLSVIVGILMIFLIEMPQAGAAADSTFRTFRYFTTDSNLLMGIFALVFLIDQILELKGKIQEIPSYVYLLKLIGTVQVSVTFFTVVFYLAPALGENFYVMFLGHNFFYHLFVPVLSMVSFLFLEKTEKISFRKTFFSMLPVLVYGIYYMANAFLHMTDGKVPPEYDWYGFAQGGVALSFVAFIAMMIATYLITLLFWFLNRKRKKKEKQR